MEQLEKAEMALKETAYQPRNHTIIGFRRRQKKVREENLEHAKDFSKLEEEIFKDESQKHNSDDQFDVVKEQHILDNVPAISTEIERESAIEEKKAGDVNQSQLPTNIEKQIKKKEQMQESLSKSLHFIKKAQDADLVFMEDGNLLNAEFLKNQLGVNPSKTILIMDDCEEFTNKVEENHSAEITRQQIEFLLNFFKTLIQQEDPLLQGSNMNPKIAILDIEYKIQFQEQELEVVNEFIEALKILEDLMSNFNSYNFILRTDDQKEGWEFDGLRYRSYTDDILTQITLKSGKFNSTKIKQSISYIKIQWTISSKFKQKIYLFSGKEINFSIVLEMKRLVLFNEGLQENLYQSKEFGISWRYIINFFDKIRQYHGGNITCIVEDVKTGEGFIFLKLRLQFVSVNEIPNFNSLSSFHSVILGSSIWKNNVNPFKLDPNFTRRTFPCGIPRQNLLIMPITSLASGRKDSFDFKTGLVRSEQANDLGLMLQDLSERVKGGIIVLFANQTLMGKITEKWVDQIQYDEPGDDWAGDLFKGRYCVIENSAPNHYESEEWANTMSQYHKSSTSGKGAIYLATIRSQRLESMQFTEEESRCVVIVGVSFGSVDTRCTIKKNRQNGFNEYYLPEAVNQVNRVVAKFLQKGDTKKLVVLADRRQMVFIF